MAVASEKNRAMPSLKFKWSVSYRSFREKILCRYFQVYG